jgi:hypothetical protein
VPDVGDFPGSEEIPGTGGERVAGTDRWTFTADRDKIRDLLTSGDGPIGKSMLRLVLKAEGSAKHRCPVDTGRLRGSITHRVEQEENAVVGVVGTNVEYAPYVEFGTERTAPSAFLRGGVDEAVRTLGGP